MEVLDYITDNIHNTLTHPKGKELFASYLVQFPEYLAYFNVYDACSKLIELIKLIEEQNQTVHGDSLEEFKSLEILVIKVKNIQKIVSDLNEIDFSLMNKFEIALESKTKETLFTILKDTKIRCQDCLLKKHEPFRNYIIDNYILR